jgi:hypothetical protein
LDFKIDSYRSQSERCSDETCTYTLTSLLLRRSPPTKFGVDVSTFEVDGRWGSAPGIYFGPSAMLRVCPSPKSLEIAIGLLYNEENYSNIRQLRVVLGRLENGGD